MVLLRFSVAAVLLACMVTPSQGSSISLQGSPTTVKDGLTRTVRLTCALNDTAASPGVIGRRDTRDVTHTPYNVAELLSIIVIQNASDVAVVTHVTSAEVKDARSTNLRVSGQVQNTASGQGFLEVTWDNPSASQLEDMECRITTMDQSGHSVIFSQVFEFDVTEPKVMDIVAHVAMLEKERDVANAKIQMLESGKAETDRLLNEMKSETNDMRATIGVLKSENSAINLTVDALKRETNDMKTTIGVLKNENNVIKTTIAHMGHIETGRVCEGNVAIHLNSSGNGLRDNAITVKFQRAYDKPPKVIFGTVKLDTVKDSNLRYVVSPVNIDGNGFITQISTWADSIVYKVCVDWVSFPE